MMSTAVEALSWQDVLGEEKKSPYFQKILAFVKAEREKGKKIYPPHEAVFNAFKFTSYSDVRVVIVGQDPYHGAGQAHGLCFSVRRGVQAPPSLKNIFKELHNDVGFTIPNHGCLENWASQGVLLLNSVLTVDAGKPGSHSKIGWQQFTDKVIDTLNDHPKPIVFLLWGAYAQRKGHKINREKHLVLEAAHPSPFSAHRGFLGCRHFSKANEFLRAHHRGAIDWSL